jgi:hypothetical protein
MPRFAHCRWMRAIHSSRSCTVTYLWATTTQFVEFKGMESLRR